MPFHLGDRPSMLSASSSEASIADADNEELVIVVTSDGSRPDLPAWMCIDTHVAYVDARMRSAWPALAELNVPLGDLPCVYMLHTHPRAWLERPRRLGRHRIRRHSLAHHPAPGTRHATA